MTFWILAMGVAVAAAAAILYAMARGGEGPRARPDLAVYRDQLSEVERDLARGVLEPDEAERARTEVARRLLAADKTGAAALGAAPRALTRVAMGLVVLAVIAGAALLYIEIGVPGYDDQPLAKRMARAEELRQSRPVQAEAEAAAATALPDLPQGDPEFLDLMTKLRGAVAERPNDLEGLRLLARNEAGLGNFAAAARAQERILQLSEAPSSEQYTDLVEFYIAAAGGIVSREAEDAIGQALQIDPGNKRARYFAGYAFYQVGRTDLTFRIWSRLLEEGPESAPWIRPIRSEIGVLARMAGANDYVPPQPQGPGPSAADMAAAADMTPEERQDMIRGMVDRLAERLATEGGNADDWSRLINALGILGDTDRAAAIWGEAQQVFAASPADLAALRGAAEAAGVATAAAPGPTAEDVEAAADMAPEDRQAMIRGMVDRLAERLTTEGGPAADWARLLNALGVLGDTGRAAEIWDEARQVFGASPEDLAIVQAEAEAIGVAGE